MAQDSTSDKKVKAIEIHLEMELKRFRAIDMFGFFKPEIIPKPCPGNPGQSLDLIAQFQEGTRQWIEKVNLMQVAELVFPSKLYRISKDKTWLTHKGSGFTILPRIVSYKHVENRGVQTISTVQINHPKLIPDGIFEYQHSFGANLAESFAAGLDQWMNMDFVPLLDAWRSYPEQCTAAEWALPVSCPTRKRRVIFGTPIRMMGNPPPEPLLRQEEHSFCHCCLLTRSHSIFRELIEGDEFYGVRLFAARGADGVATADCRVNGHDWQQGAEALKSYVNTWVDYGFEYRKQYVVILTVNK